MNKFKVGDKVKVVKEYFNSFPLGTTGVITESYETNQVAYDVQQDGVEGQAGCWPVCEDELELVS